MKTYLILLYRFADNRVVELELNTIEGIGYALRKAQAEYCDNGTHSIMMLSDGRIAARQL